MKIGITYNLKPRCHPEQSEGSAFHVKNEILCASSGAQNDIASDIFEEFDAPETIEAIASVLRSAGHEVIKIEADSNFLSEIQNQKPDFVFNIAEGYEGRNRESYVPNLLEFLGIPHTGSDGFALALSLDKELTKMMARRVGVRTPESWVVEPGARFMNLALGSDKVPGTLFVKPLREGSSKGIRLSSVVHNQKEFETECARLWENYGDIPLLAETFIKGREVTVGVLGTEKPRVLGTMEIRWKKKNEKQDFIYSLEVKRDWRRLVEYEAPAPLSESQSREIEAMAIKIHRALECRDISRVDFRIDEKGVPYFLEINPLPGLSPDYSDLVIMIRQLDMSYQELIFSIFQEAVNRQRHQTPDSRPKVRN